jgi:probable HAF family extracellular repeat protein
MRLELCRILAGAAALTGCDRSLPITEPDTPTPVSVQTITLSPQLGFVTLGSSVPVTATLRDANGSLASGRKVAWSTSDAAIATVTATGNVTARINAVGHGTVSITAVADGVSGSVSFVVQGETAFVYTPADGIIGIPMPSWVAQSHALAINEAGQVVGEMRVASTGGRAFIWSRETGLVDLGTLPGTTTTGFGAKALAINNLGEVAGFVGTDSGVVHAFKWSASTGMVDLGIPPDGHHAFASGINDSGVVVGEVWMRTGVAVRPFRWTKSRGMELLDPPPGFGARATGINVAGTISGSLIPANDPYGLDEVGAVMWRPSGARVDISAGCATGHCEANALAINRAGQIVGSTAGGFPYVWSEARGMIELETSGSATAINDLGHVTGTLYNGLGGFVWTDATGIRSLPIWAALGGPPLYPTAINTAGQVAGYATR